MPDLLKALDRSVNLRGTHVEMRRDDGHRRSLLLVAQELQSDHNILRL